MWAEFISNSVTFFILRAAPHEGLLTLLGAAPHEEPLTMLTLYWELSPMRVSCHSIIWVSMVTNISASLSKPRLHSNANGFSPKMPKLFKQLNFLVAMATYWFPW